MLLFTLEEDYVSSEFSSLLSKTFSFSGLEQLFNIAFVFTVETGFIPISLAKHFNSINSNIQLAKMINKSPLNSFWYQNNNIYTAQLVMSNQECYLIGVPNGKSLIITLCHLNISKCMVLEKKDIFFSKYPVKFSHLSLKYKNTVSVPVKCAILDVVSNLYPNICGLPEELILDIMAKLDAPHLYALIRCCRKLYLLAINNQFIWRKILIKEFSRLTVDQFSQRNEPVINWREYYFGLKRHKYCVRRTRIVRE